MSALSYCIKWNQVADLPAPMYGAYVTVQDKKIYVAGGSSPVDDAEHQVYVYDVNTDHWGQLPPSGHYYGIPHIIGGKLAIIGGRLSATKKRTNKVSTFDETSQTWTSYYPDLHSVRSKPGVVTHLEHVIVAGGGSDNITLDDIEVLDWIENSYWKKVAVKLPDPMYAFTPIIANDHYFIVGYTDDDMKRDKHAYKIVVNEITKSGNVHTKWVTMTTPTHWHTALVPGLSPPVVVGGEDQSCAATPDITMYDGRTMSWRSIDSLPSARSHVAIATIDNSVIIAIGGCSKGECVDDPDSSSLTTVELGQAQIIN